MKKILTLLFSLTATVCAYAQNDVTSKYIKNNDFEVNYLTYWTISNMQMQNNASFSKNGGVYVEKWTSNGGKVGNASITQTIAKLPQGKYTLIARAHNIQQNKTDEQTGAYIFAGEENTTVTAADDYKVDFTHVHGDVSIGFKAVNATGNWICVDNFRLYRNGDAYDGAQADDDAMYAAEKDSLANLYANGTGAMPTVKTNPYVATGGVFALGRATFTANGATIAQRGFCYSASNHEPTVLDSITTYTYSHEGNIYVIEPLQPATFYWVRPYAITKDNQVAYGEAVKICTLPKASCTWSWDYAGDDEQNARCVQAVSNGIVNYNECSAIKGFHLSGHYVYGAGAGGGTADCSYGGWMRISQSTSYQRTGTVQHEFAHGVGVGTSSRYADKNLHNWEWYGPRANKLAQFFENSKEVQVVGDGTHSWVQNANGRTGTLIAYGINGAHEDNNTQLLYRANAMMIEAMCEDGMNPTTSYTNGISCYTFNYDENKKYYIKCEDPELGLYDGYLYQRGTTNTSWNVFDTPSDTAAWYIEYLPSQGYYTFRNAATGKYLTHKAGANSVQVKTIAAGKNPASTEYVQLMPARADVTIGAGKSAMTLPSFWFCWSESGANKVMQAKAVGTFSGYGAASIADLKFTNDAKSQRFVIVSEDELEAFNATAEAVGIKSIMADDKTEIANGEGVEGVYSIGGMRMSDVKKGINIIRNTDGTSKKVYIK